MPPEDLLLSSSLLKLSPAVPGGDGEDTGDVAADAPSASSWCRLEMTTSESPIIWLTVDRIRFKLIGHVGTGIMTSWVGLHPSPAVSWWTFMTASGKLTSLEIVTSSGDFCSSLSVSAEHFLPVIRGDFFPSFSSSSIPIIVELMTRIKRIIRLQRVTGGEEDDDASIRVVMTRNTCDPMDDDGNDIYRWQQPLHHLVLRLMTGASCLLSIGFDMM